MLLNTVIAAATLLARMIIRALILAKMVFRFGLFVPLFSSTVRWPARRTATASQPRSGAARMATIALETFLVVGGSGLFAPQRDLRMWYVHRLPGGCEGGGAEPRAAETSKVLRNRQRAYSVVAHTQREEIMNPTCRRVEVVSSNCVLHILRDACDAPDCSSAAPGVVLVWIAMPWEIGDTLDHFVSHFAAGLGMNAAILCVREVLDDDAGCEASLLEVRRPGQDMAYLVTQVWSEVELLVTTRRIQHFFIGGQQVAGAFCTHLKAAEEVSALSPLGMILVDPFVGITAIDECGTDEPGASSIARVSSAITAAVSDEMAQLTRGRTTEWLPSRLPTAWRSPVYILALDDGLWCPAIIAYAMQRSNAGGDVRLDLYRTRRFASARGDHGIPVPEAVEKVRRWANQLACHALGSLSYTPSYLSAQSTPHFASRFHSMAPAILGAEADGEGHVHVSDAVARWQCHQRALPPTLGGLRISGDNLQSMMDGSGPQTPSAASVVQFDFVGTPTSSPSAVVGQHGETPRLSLAGLPSVASRSSLSGADVESDGSRPRGTQSTSSRTATDC